MAIVEERIEEALAKKQSEASSPSFGEQALVWLVTVRYALRYALNRVARVDVGSGETIADLGRKVYCSVSKAPGGVKRCCNSCFEYVVSGALTSTWLYVLFLVLQVQCVAFALCLFLYSTSTRTQFYFSIALSVCFMLLLGCAAFLEINTCGEKCSCFLPRVHKFWSTNQNAISCAFMFETVIDCIFFWQIGQALYDTQSVITAKAGERHVRLGYLWSGIVTSLLGVYLYSVSLFLSNSTSPQAKKWPSLLKPVAFLATDTADMLVLIYSAYNVNFAMTNLTGAFLLLNALAQILLTALGLAVVDRVSEAKLRHLFNTHIRKAFIQFVYMHDFVIPVVISLHFISFPAKILYRSLVLLIVPLAAFILGLFTYAVDHYLWKPTLAPPGSWYPSAWLSSSGFLFVQSVVLLYFTVLLGIRHGPFECDEEDEKRRYCLSGQAATWMLGLDGELITAEVKHYALGAYLASGYLVFVLLLCTYLKRKSWLLRLANSSEIRLEAKEMSRFELRWILNRLNKSLMSEGLRHVETRPHCQLL